MVKITTNIDIVKFDSLVLKLDLYSGMFRKENIESHFGMVGVQRNNLICQSS